MFCKCYRAVFCVQHCLTIHTSESNAKLKNSELPDKLKKEINEIDWRNSLKTSPSKNLNPLFNVKTTHAKTRTKIQKKNNKMG